MSAAPQLIPRKPRRKRQPSAERMREQLALSADAQIAARAEAVALRRRLVATRRALFAGAQDAGERAREKAIAKHEAKAVQP